MAENHVHGELTTSQCYNACRQLLKDRNGYECGTEEGTFLAAFASGTDALQFCVVVSAAWLCSAVSFLLCMAYCWMQSALLSACLQQATVPGLLQLLVTCAAAEALARLRHQLHFFASRLSTWPAINCFAKGRQMSAKF